MFWNLIIADFVRPPNAVDSIPGDPAPESATIVFESEFKNACKHLTSSPFAPIVKFLVNEIPMHAGIDTSTCSFSWALIAKTSTAMAANPMNAQTIEISFLLSSFIFLLWRLVAGHAGKTWAANNRCAVLAFGIAAVIFA